jgi:hypothetical protein
MDERQTQIRQGAGLEESRINTDLIDFLNKWSSPVLIVIGLIGLGWAGLRYMERARIAKINNAYAAYEGAMAGGSPSPASLRNIATEFDGVGSVSEMALLRTVDIYLRAAIAGIEPGAEIDPVTGRPAQESDVLDAERTRNYLSQARDLAASVVASTEGEDGKGLLRIQALMRLGAAREGLGSIEEAKSAYASAAQAATAAGFPELAIVAESRAAAADGLAEVPTLPSRADLAPLPGDELLNSSGEVPMTIEEIMSMPSLGTNNPSGDSGTVEGSGDGAAPEQPAEPAAEPTADPSSGDEPPAAGGSGSP